MITDKQTNTLYFSNLLPEAYPDEFIELLQIIKEQGYMVKLLRATHDFYCRDYLPIQISDNSFVQFVFRPKAYFKEEWFEEITNPVVVELVNGILQPMYSPIILDGGNVIKGESKAIISSRVLIDNRYQFESDEAIIQRLKTDLECEIIIIPEYPNEITGHADGLIRFINNDTVFINDTKNEREKEWLNEFLKVLINNNIKYIELPSEVDNDMETAEGLYIDYLHIGNLVIVPQFGSQKSDTTALEIMQNTFGKNYEIVACNANWLAESGGVFNGACWGIKA